jgi:hypothetical protein
MSARFVRWSGLCLAPRRRSTSELYYLDGVEYGKDEYDAKMLLTGLCLPVRTSEDMNELFREAVGLQMRMPSPLSDAQAPPGQSAPCYRTLGE